MQVIATNVIFVRIRRLRRGKAIKFNEIASYAHTEKQDKHEKIEKKQTRE